MASIVKLSNGRKAVQFFTEKRRKRHTIHLGKISQGDARIWRGHVERLVVAALMGRAPEFETAAWVSELSADYQAKLHRHGLIEAAAKRCPVATLADLLDEYDKIQASNAPSTRENARQIRRNLLDYFGGRRSLADITPAAAKQFRAHLLTHGKAEGGGLAPATVSRRIRRVRHLFKLAADCGWIAENPFEAEGHFSEVNRANDFFVSVKLANQVLAEMRDPENVAAFVLTRWGGLRFPSEVLPLIWESVIWDKGLLHVWSPKTKSHPGGQERFVPLFPEVREVLNLLWDKAEPGDPLVLPGRQKSATATTNAVGRACRAAGVVQWPRSWDNLRASRCVELMSVKPMSELPEIAEWMGHSVDTLLRHYAQIVKEQRATAAAGESVLQLGELHKAPSQEGDAMQNAQHS